MTEALSFQQGDDAWHNLRRRAMTDLFWFNSAVLGLVERFPLLPETHLVPHRFMQRNTGNPEIDFAPYQLLLWPRECGKSSCGTVGYATWLGCKYPDISILIANEKEETARDFIKSIKWHFENNTLLRALFPEVIPPDLNKVEWSATRATLHRTSGRPEATFDCTGVGGSKVGKHYDVILCDDLIAKEGLESMKRGNWMPIKETNRWISQLQPLLSVGSTKMLGPGFPFIRFIGTRWFKGDSYDHIIKVFGRSESPKRYRISAELASSRKVSRTVERAGDLTSMVISAIENGQTTFPEIWPIDRIENIRFDDEFGPEFIACNLLNNPSDAAVVTFHDEWLRYWQFLDGTQRSIMYRTDDGTRRHVTTDELLKLAVTDPAFSSNSDGSRCAIIVVGTDMATGKHLVLDASAEHKDPKDNLEDFLNTLQRWDCRRAFVEIAGQQRAYLQWLQTEAQRRSLPVAFFEVKPSGRAKDVRIEGLQVPFKQGQIYVHPSHSVLLDDEYRHWRPGARQADVLDALAYAMENVPKPAVRGDARSPKDRSQYQLDVYRRRRGLAPLASSR